MSSVRPRKRSLQRKLSRGIFCALAFSVAFKARGQIKDEIFDPIQIRVRPAIRDATGQSERPLKQDGSILIPLFFESEPLGEVPVLLDDSGKLLGVDAEILLQRLQQHLQPDILAELQQRFRGGYAKPTAL